MDFIVYDSTSHHFLTIGTEIDGASKQFVVYVFDTLGNEISTHYYHDIYGNERVSYFEKVEDDLYAIKTHLGYDCADVYQAFITYFKPSTGSFSNFSTNLSELYDYKRLNAQEHIQVGYINGQYTLQYSNQANNINWATSLFIDHYDNIVNTSFYQTADSNFIYCNEKLMWKIDRLNGNRIQTQSFEDIIVDVLYYQGGHYVLTQKKIFNRPPNPRVYQLDENLQILQVFSLDTILGDVADLKRFDTAFRVTGGNKTILFDDNFNAIQVDTFQENVVLSDAIMFNDQIFLTGSKYQGKNIREGGQGHYGLVLELSDANTIGYENIDLSIDNIQYSASPLSCYTYSPHGHWDEFVCSIHLSNITFQVTNRGSTPIDFFEINHTDLDASDETYCRIVHFEVALENDSIMPNEQRELTYSNIQLGGLPRHDEICFWVAAPNHQLDINNNNDVKCISVTLGSTNNGNNGNGGGINTPSVTLEDISVSFFPNPTVNELSLEFSSRLDENVNAKIYNAQGKLVEETILFSSRTAYTFDTRTLATGVYLLVLESGNGFIVAERFIKMEY